jgi:tetratricopeptide (TPR) repeat protein
VLLLALVAGVGAFAVHTHRVQTARADLAEGREFLQGQRYADASRAFARGLGRLERLPGTGELTDQLRDGLAQAHRAAAADELHDLAEQLRFLAGADSSPAKLGSELDRRCRECWRVWESDDPAEGAHLSRALRERIRGDLLDLAILWAGQLARAGSKREAGILLDEAETRLGASPVLTHERAVSAGVRVAAPARKRLPAHEHLALGRSWLCRGELTEAGWHLEQALRLSPGSFWANYYQGACCLRQGRAAEALPAFHACVALAPGRAESYFNRGLAYSALGRRARARDDYDRALRLRPTLATAWLNRGVLRYHDGQPNDALADLREALRYGADPVAVHFNLAVVQQDRGERSKALWHVEQVLRRRPGHAEAKALRERLMAP